MRAVAKGEMDIDTGLDLIQIIFRREHSTKISASGSGNPKIHASFTGNRVARSSPKDE
jgi:hypothetical protein